MGRWGQCSIYRHPLPCHAKTQYCILACCCRFIAKLLCFGLAHSYLRNNRQTECHHITYNSRRVIETVHEIVIPILTKIPVTLCFGLTLQCGRTEALSRMRLIQFTFMSLTAPADAVRYLAYYCCLQSVIIHEHGNDGSFRLKCNNKSMYTVVKSWFCRTKIYQQSILHNITLFLQFYFQA